MRRHPIDLLSLLLGGLTIALAVAALSGVISVEWLEPAYVVSMGALISVAAVAAVLVNWLLRRRHLDDDTTESS